MVEEDLEVLVLEDLEVGGQKTPWRTFLGR